MILRFSLWLSFFSICFFLVTGGVLAQTTTGATQIETELLGQNLEINAQTGEVLDISFEGVEVEEPTGIPTPWRMLLKRFQDQAVILATLDPVKRAEKRLQFAEERRRLAEFILENTDNPQLQLRAKRLVESAEKLFERLEKTKGDWTKLTGERVERLMRNAAVHQVRRERLFDRLEAELPEDQANIVRELRAQGLERGMRLLNAINNENVPEEIREHLRDVRERIQEHQGEVREYQQRRRALQESVRQGDEVARQALQDLREERHERVQERVLERQEQQAAVQPQLEEVKARLRAAAQAGNEDAARVLRQIEEVEARVRLQAQAQVVPQSQPAPPPPLQQPARPNLDIRGGVELREIEQPQNVEPPAPAPATTSSASKKRRLDRNLVPLRAATSSRSPASILDLQPIQPRVELPRINIGF